MKKTLTFIILLFSVGIATAQETDTKKFYEGACVRISSLDQYAKPVYGMGFFISRDGILLAPYHMFEDTSTVVISSFDGKRYWKYEMVEYLERSDIVKIKVHDFSEGSPFLKISDDVPIDDDKGFVLGLDERGQIRETHGFLSTVRIVDNIGPAIMAFMPIEDQHNGAPLFNEKEEVIGIVSYQVINHSERNFIISTEATFNMERVEQSFEDKRVEQDSVIVEKEGVKLTEEELREIFSTYYDSLKIAEIRLQPIGDSIQNSWNQWGRMGGIMDFIPAFVKVLQYPKSFYYPFDSFYFMFKIDAPDNSFRIFSWTLKFDDGTYRYYGAIQFRADTLSLVPLFDASDKMPYHMLEDTVLTNESWYGMQYYDIFRIRKKRKNYYILLGWDGNNPISDKKVIEVLHFDKEMNPIFGAPIFYDKNRQKHRKVFEYNDVAIMVLKYLPTKNFIVFDHLVPRQKKHEGKTWLYVPDGSYDYFKIKRGKLVFHEEVFENEKLSEKEVGE